jgi:hypothetical protein
METNPRYKMDGAMTHSSPRLSVTQFVGWIQSRIDAGETRTRIARDLGVTHVAVHLWLAGKRPPSATVLLLAERLMLEPREMAAGLPAGDVLKAGG